MSDDTHDQIPENSLLASAYLDGEVTADERALVETNPEALDEVAALSQVSTVLAATAPAASLSEREAHLAGALDVWERMSDLERSGEATPAAGVDAAAAAALMTPVSSSQGRRGRAGRNKSKRSGSSGASQWFLGAAATLVVVAGAAAVFRGILADDGDGADEVSIEAAADDSAELSDVEANEAAEVNGEDVGADVVPDTDLIEGEAQSDPASDDERDGGLFPEDEALQDEPMQTEAMEEGTTEDATDDANDDATETASAAGEQPAPAPEFGLLEIETPDMLADYGSLVVFAGAPGGPVITSDVDFEAPGESCEAELGIEEILEPVLYRGQQVFVGVDLDNDVVFAYLDDCTVVESVALPTTPSATQP